MTERHLRRKTHFRPEPWQNPFFAHHPEKTQFFSHLIPTHPRSSRSIPDVWIDVSRNSRDEFIAMMRAFSANERPATVMGRISRGYTAEQIAILAAHYARPQ